jgi:hypothetical protein
MAAAVGRESGEYMKMRTDRRAGQSTVEAALALPLFLIMIFGVIDFGFRFFVHETIVWQATRAVRWGAVHSWNPAMVANVFLCSRADACSSTFMGLSSGNVSVAKAIDSSDPGGEQYGTTKIVVRITNYQLTQGIPFLYGTYTGEDVVASQPYECANGVTCTP